MADYTPYQLPAPVDPSDPPPGGGGGGGGTPTPTPTPTPPPSPIGTEIFNLTFVKHEANSILECMAYCNVASQDDLQFTAYLWVDNALAQYALFNMTFSEAQSYAKAPLTIPMFVSGLAIGSHNIKFTIRNQENTGDALTVLAGATIKLTEIKRASQ